MGQIVAYSLAWPGTLLHAALTKPFSAWLFVAWLVMTSAVIASAWRGNWWILALLYFATAAWLTHTAHSQIKAERREHGRHSEA